MKSRITSWINERAGVIMVLLAFVVGGTYVVQVHRISTREQCFASYNQAFASQAATQARISQASDAAQTALLGGIGQAIVKKPTTDPKEQAKRTAAFLKLFTDFRIEADRVAAERAAVPLPNLPNC